jgi:hypothetical protein
MWRAMIERVGAFRSGEIHLSKLEEDLRGLYVEADPHDARIREDFESVWSPIDQENELRTEPWAPAGAASDANLDRALSEFVVWVDTVVASDSSDEHR